MVAEELTVTLIIRKRFIVFKKEVKIVEKNRIN